MHRAFWFPWIYLPFIGWITSNVLLTLQRMTDNVNDYLLFLVYFVLN